MRKTTASAAVVALLAVAPSADALNLVHARLAPAHIGGGKPVVIVFRVPHDKPKPPPADPSNPDSPDGDSYYFARVETSRTRPHCDAEEPSAQLGGAPGARNDVVVGRTTYRPGQLARVPIRPQRGPWCRGRFKVTLSVAYYTVPGPGSVQIELRNLAVVHGRVH